MQTLASPARLDKLPPIVVLTLEWEESRRHWSCQLSPLSGVECQPYVTSANIGMVFSTIASYGYQLQSSSSHTLYSGTCLKNEWTRTKDSHSFFPAGFGSLTEASENYFAQFGPCFANGNKEGALTLQHVFELDRDLSKFEKLRSMLHASNKRLETESAERACDSTAARTEQARLEGELQSLRVLLNAQKHESARASAAKDEEINALRSFFEAQARQHAASAAGMSEEMSILRNQLREYKSKWNEHRQVEVLHAEQREERLAAEMGRRLAAVANERDILQMKLDVLSRCLNMPNEPKLAETIA